MTTFGDILEIEEVKRDRVLAVVDLDEMDDQDEVPPVLDDSFAPKPSLSTSEKENKIEDVAVVPKLLDSVPGIIKIKEEPVDDDDFDPTLKIKNEPEDDDDDITDITDSRVSVNKTDMITATTDVLSSIDGNVELCDTPENSQSATSSKIKISISKVSLAASKSDSDKEKSKEAEKEPEPEEPVDTFVPPPFTVDYDLKPGFRGVELKDMPCKNIGFETSNLCSIM